MNEKEFMEALSGVQQDMLDELAEWQNAGTPLTDKAITHDPSEHETHVRTVSGQRRSNTMEKKHKKHIHHTRILPLTAGMCAAAAAVAIVCIPIGREVIGKNDSMQAGQSPESSVTDQITESTFETVPLNTESLAEIEADTSEQYPAWFWDSYSGDDIPLPDGKTVRVIRTAADGQDCLTHSGQQDETALETLLSAGWLETGGTEFTDPVSETGIYNEGGEAQDVIFIGIPESGMPRNTVSCSYHNGTVTPSGRLHLDLSVLTVSDAAEEKLPQPETSAKNLYFFISVPDGCLPEITGWDVTFTEYHSDAVPEQALADESAVWEWRDTLPEFSSYMFSVLGDKYISLIPDETAGQVTVTGSWMQNIAGVPEGDAGVLVRTEPETDTIKMIFSIPDISCATAITDLSVSADGMLSVTLHVCGSDMAAETAPNASAVWTLSMPHGSLPEIRDISCTSVPYSEDASDPECDGYAFISKAGRMITVACPYAN